MAGRGLLGRLLSVGAIGVAVVAGLPGGTAGAAAGVQVVPTPEQTRPAGLSAVSFSSATDAWSVGSIGESLADSGVDTLIEHWNGSAWTVTPTTLVPFSDETLTGVVALNPSDAWAVGRQDRYGYNDDVPLLLHFDGTRWTRTRPPTAAIPSAMGASAPEDIWAVGAGVLQHFDGTSWSATAVPDQAAVLTGVTVRSPADAWAVGFKPVDKPGYNHTANPYVAHWDGLSWRTVFVPHPSTDARLASVSASSASDVWAVGSWLDQQAGGNGTYALHFDGSSWRQVPVPDKGTFNALNGVVAVSPTEAYAVGHRDGYNAQGYAVWKTLLERWDGMSWTVMTSPNDSNTDNYLTSVDATGSDLWAAGSDGGTLVERLALG